MSNIKPNRGYVAIDPIFEADTYTTRGGLELVKPDQYKGRCTQGIVKYIGDGVTKVVRGDYVFFSAYSGTLWNYKDELLIIMAEKRCEAKLSVDSDTEIPGLYFKEMGVSKELVEEITGTLKLFDCLSQTLCDELIRLMLVHTSYFPATYAHAIKFIASAFDSIPTKDINPNDPNNFLELEHANIEDR